MPVLFALTIFTSATLLFMVQPMVGRMILPLLGGSPAAWNTCMVFFQALLLLGYLYAHLVSTRLTGKKQALVHGGVLLGAIIAMGLASAFGPSSSPIAVVKSLAPQGSSYPMFGVLALLFVAIGAPFFVVSTSAPLLQRWFTMTGHPSAKDPYFLYAASNAGSLISLLGYPFIVEPSLTLSAQAWVWAVGFSVLFVLFMVCGKVIMKRAPLQGPVQNLKTQGEAPTLRRKLKWMMLAFVPSSLMLGVTFHMTTDIASIPLLWVIPLALYLLTFIIAYARMPSWFRPVLGNVSPVGTLLLVFVLTAALSSSVLTPFFSILLHIVVYFLTALLMHTELAFDRPAPQHLTNYFLWISVGGMLGGIFNGLIAPILFPDNWEYRIAITVGAMLIPVLNPPKPLKEGEFSIWNSVFFDVIVPLAMVALVGTLTWASGKLWYAKSCIYIAKQTTEILKAIGFKGNISIHTISSLITYAIPAMLCFLFIDRPIRFGLCVGAILLVAGIRTEQSRVIETHRSFFGILRVTEHHLDYDDSDDLGRCASVFFYERNGNTYFHADKEDYIQLVHGTTLHGTQAIRTWHYTVKDDMPRIAFSDPWNAILRIGAYEAFDQRQEPLTYYHRTGPVGEAFEESYRRHPMGHVGMVGLGTGSVACYAQPNQKMTFYEIDPTVVKIVDRPRNPNPDLAKRSFTYLTDARSRGADVELILGDARLKLEEQPERKYSLLLVDAFSSDSIPVHLLTKEAVQLYFNRIENNGLLMIHVSNKFVKLEPVVAKIAEELKVVARVWSDSYERHPGKTASSWIVLARNEEELGRLGKYAFVAEDPLPLSAVAGWMAWKTYAAHWEYLVLIKDVKLWTDQFADVLQMMMLDEIQSIRKLFGQTNPLEKKEK